MKVTAFCVLGRLNEDKASSVPRRVVIVFTIDVAALPRYAFVSRVNPADPADVKDPLPGHSPDTQVRSSGSAGMVAPRFE